MSFDGKQLGFYVAAPNLETQLTHYENMLVSSEIEIMNVNELDIEGDGWGTVDARIEVSGGIINYEVMHFLNGTFPVHEFNGYVFEDNSNALRPIVDVDIVAATNTFELPASAVTFTDDSIMVDVSGLLYRRFTVFELDVAFGSFGDNANNVLTGENARDWMYGGSGRDTLRGLAGKDQLYGEAGNDRLLGGGSSDFLKGGIGNDSLTGGGGADRFYFDTSLNSASNVDVIDDFAANDILVLDNDIFTALGAVFTLGEFHSVETGTSFDSVDSSDKIIYIKSEGSLYYDADGSGLAHQPVLFATLGANTTLDFEQFLLVA